ncbi:hypothetical protein [Massilia suwonensis]
MADAQPTLMPERIDSDSIQSPGGSTSAPTQSPPAFAGGGAYDTSAATGARLMSPPPALQSAPTLPTSGSSIGSGVSAWQNNKQIDALWTINEDRNSWIGVTGVGWRKLAPGTETSVIALSMLAAHARSVNAPVNYRDESDNLVHEIYVW